MIPFYPSRFLSHALILIMGVVTVGDFIFPLFSEHFAFRGASADISVETLFSLVLFQFIHGNTLHWFMNSFFLYQAGPEVESRMSREMFVRFFVISTLFVAGSLVLFSRASTIGMSGFCMALLSYLYMELSTMKHPHANQILIMLIMNILLGLSGGISFTAHAAGAVIGIIWWKIYKK